MNTKIPEFSYPTSEGNVYTSYKGGGGVALDSLLKRAVFASSFRTAKILLSSDIKNESRILYNRNIVERVGKIAPFLMLDSDPYIVVSDEGRLYWMIDAYIGVHPFAVFEAAHEPRQLYEKLREGDGRRVHGEGGSLRERPR